jgi:hypothetical protein
MREHRYSLELPHSAARIWALMRDNALCFSVAPRHDRWSEYAPMVLDTKVVDPGDAQGNGLVRLLVFKKLFGQRGLAREVVTDVEPERGYTFHMGREIGTVRLEPLGPDRTRVHFYEQFHIRQRPWKWFEGLIYRYINRQNERSLQGFSRWLSDHPEYRPDLVESAPGQVRESRSA